MKTLKESILSDIETQIDKGTNVVNNMAKIRELVPLFNDRTSAHYTRYDQSDWKDYIKGHGFVFGQSIAFRGGYKSYLKEWKRDFTSAKEVYDNFGQPGWEKVFKMAKAELKEIDVKELTNNKIKQNHSYLVIREATSNNTYTGRKHLLAITFIEKEFVNNRAKYRISRLTYSASGWSEDYHMHIDQRVESLIKKYFNGPAYNNGDWYTYIFDIDSNPDWSGIVDAVYNEFNIKKEKI